MSRDGHPASEASGIGGVLLGRWRTAPSGLFTWMDQEIWELVALPLVPLTSLGWEDLVVPGTDLAFLERRSFSGQPVRVGISGGVRVWAISGRRTSSGGELLGDVRIPSSPPPSPAPPSSPSSSPAERAARRRRGA